MFPINAGIRFFFPSNHDYFWVLAEQQQQQQSCVVQCFPSIINLSPLVCVCVLFVSGFFLFGIFSGHIFPSGYDILFPELLFFLC